jgi:signal transduction histidine kinase/DNA-binding response OmpR family regulator
MIPSITSRSRKKSSRWLLSLLWLLFFGYLAIITLVTIRANSNARAQLLDAIDRSLLLGTNLLAQGLPKDLHDRALAAHGISKEEDEANILLLSRLAEDNGLHYLYAFVLDGDHIRFTTSSATPAEIAESKQVHCWDAYSEAPEAARGILIAPEGGPQASSYTDRWGTFRSVFVPHRSPSGLLYGIGADYSLAEVNARLAHATRTAIGVGAVIAIAGFFLVLGVHLIARRLQRAIASQELLAQVAQATSNGVAIATVDGQIKWTNPAFAHHGQGETIQQILAQHQQVAPAFAQRRGLTSEGPGAQGGWFRADLRPIENAWILVLHDLTEHKQLEQALRAAQLVAESATIAKSAFLANMSHEIRTPMNGVLGMTELLINSGLSEEQKGYAKTVRRSGESLLALLNDILDLSKVEAGKMTIEALPTDVIQIVHDVVDLLHTRVAQGSVELLVRITPQLAAGAITDPLRIRQVLTNLLNNALKFTKRGHVLVDVSAVASEAGRRRWTLRIEDTGIGITSAQLATLFKPFTQAEQSIARNFGGTGLGLSISKHLVELMGGQLEVSSTPGLGTEFTVTLELPDAILEEAPLPELVRLTGVRVLVVDDHSINRRILLEQLSSAGMDCQCVDGSGLALIELGIAAGTGRPFAIVITDYRLPEMNGDVLAETLRDDVSYGSPALVLYTSEPLPNHATWIREHGFSGYLVKPARAEHLLALLCRIMDPASGESTGTRCPVRPLQRARRPKLLVADDNLVNRTVARTMLEWLGCDVTCVADGAQAVAAWRTDTWDIVLMDCQMPGIDGFEATAQIRVAETGGAHVKIVAVTANIDSGDRERCLATGMDDYLPKPITMDGLSQALTRWLPPA